MLGEDGQRHFKTIIPINPWMSRSTRGCYGARHFMGAKRCNNPKDMRWGHIGVPDLNKNCAANLTAHNDPNIQSSVSMQMWLHSPCEPCFDKCLTSWYQIRPCLCHCLRAHRFFSGAYLVLRRAYAGLRAPQFCLRHTLTRGSLLNMNTRV